MGSSVDRESRKRALSLPFRPSPAAGTRLKNLARLLTARVDRGGTCGKEGSYGILLVLEGAGAAASLTLLVSQLGSSAQTSTSCLVRMGLRAT